MNAKKKLSKSEQPIVKLLKSEHWTIGWRDGHSEVSRCAKEFYIPDDEMVELHELLTTWRKEHKDE